MKVFDLIENDEWTSTPVTLQHLYKKQLAATHGFHVVINRLLKNNPGDPDLKMLSRWKTLPNRASGVISSDLDIDHLPYRSLELQFERMLSAKRAYEDAGGKYAAEHGGLGAEWMEVTS